MLTQYATHDPDAGTDKKQLMGLEGQLVEARRKLAVLKITARTQAKMQKDCNCAACQQKVPRDVVLARTSISSQMHRAGPAELLKKTSRQTRRQQSSRLEALHSCNDGDGFEEQISLSTDGLLLAVDKFLSTG